MCAWPATVSPGKLCSFVTFCQQQVFLMALSLDYSYKLSCQLLWIVDMLLWVWVNWTSLATGREFIFFNVLAYSLKDKKNVEMGFIIKIELLNNCLKKIKKVVFFLFVYLHTCIYFITSYYYYLLVLLLGIAISSVRWWHSVFERVEYSTFIPHHHTIINFMQTNVLLIRWFLQIVADKNLWIGRKPELQRNRICYSCFDITVPFKKWGKETTQARFLEDDIECCRSILQCKGCQREFMIIIVKKKKWRWRIGDRALLPLECTHIINIVK